MQFYKDPEYDGWYYGYHKGTGDTVMIYETTSSSVAYRTGASYTEAIANAEARFIPVSRDEFLNGWTNASARMNKALFLFARDTETIAA